MAEAAARARTDAMRGAGEEMRIGRRRFLRLAVRAAGAGALGAAGGLAYAGAVEPAWIDLERVTVRLPGLPRQAEGMRLAFLSDIHASAHAGPGRAARAVEIARGSAPHLLLLGGDYVFGRVAYGPPAVEAIARAWDPARTLAVMGNHEYWHGDSEVVARAFARAGIALLRNDAREVIAGLWIAGVDSAGEGRADIARALAPVPEGAAAILLAHEPDIGDRVAATGRVALQLSGHTHGGQVRLPWRGAILLPPHGRKYVMGLHRVGAMQLYVTRGVGVVPPPVRFLCRPEVTIIELARAG